MLVLYPFSDETRLAASVYTIAVLMVQYRVRFMFRRFESSDMDALLLQHP